VPSDPGPDLMQDNPHRSALQFTVDEVQSVSLELDVTKGAGANGRPPLILKNCASDFAGPLLLISFFLYQNVIFLTGGNFST
jgi:hypothetical protein